MTSAFLLCALLLTPAAGSGKKQRPVVEAPVEAPAAPAAAPPPPPVPPPAAPAAVAPRAKVVRIAVNDLAVSGVSPRIAQIVAESLVFELRKLDRTTVTSFDEVRQMLSLEAEKQSLGCESNDDCLAQIADALGVDYLVTGTLARVGDTHVFGLRLINQNAAAAEVTVNKVLVAGSGSEFLGEVGPAVEALFPGTPLRQGLTRGISAEMAKRLTPPPLSPVIFWSGVGTSGVLLAGSGVAALLQSTFQSDYKAIALRARTDVESGAALVAAGNNAQLAERVGWGLLGGAVLTGGLSAALIPLTDFGASNE